MGEDELKRIVLDHASMENVKRLAQTVPDDYFAWHVLATAADEEILRVNTAALATNPKSYAAWHHRRGATAEDDDRLTKALLATDPRNFHAWAYRRRAGLGAIRDIFNYSCLSDLVARGHAVDAKSVISTDPFFEGGHSVRFRDDDFAHVKIFKSHATINFAEPVRGRLCVGGHAIDLDHPVLHQKFVGAFSCDTRVSVNGKEFAARRFSKNNAFVEDLLRIDPDCVFLNVAMLVTAPDSAKWVEKLCEIDPVRRKWYRRFRDAPAVFELVEIEN